MGVALTFDDGPHPTNTLRLLEILASYETKATFFVLGSMAKANPNILKKVFAAGHQIANHSWDHPNFKKLSDAKFQQQVQDAQNAIEDILGMCLKDRLLRPPYGAITLGQRKIASSLGYGLEGWNVDPLDWKHRNAQIVAKSILDSTKDGMVVLAHDIHKTTIEAMEVVVPELAKKFTLGTVRHLKLYTTSALG